MRVNQIAQCQIYGIVYKEWTGKRRLVKNIGEDKKNWGGTVS